MINLEYGQRAVARGFLTSQRLEQVLSKQRQLANEGKKVSVRMILEKSKLLTPQQLEQVDRDLNIKVVKKKTGVINRAAPPARPAQPVSAANFAGDDQLPDVSGSRGPDPDATLYSPPPADMQERIRQEREKAKQAVRQRQQQEVNSFMEPEADPFGQDSAPSLERLDSSPKLKSLAAEQFGFASPEAEELPMIENEAPPMQPAAFDNYGAPPMQELGADQGFAQPDAGFDQGFAQPDAGFAQPAAGFDQGFAQPDAGFAQPQMDADPFGAQPAFDAAPAFDAPEPAPGGFDTWGDEAPAAPAFDAPRMPRDINQTVFSPPPPGFRPGTRQYQPEPAPEPEAEPEMAAPEPQGFDAWGDEAPAQEPAFDAEPAFGGAEPASPPDINATLFSPPPPGLKPGTRMAPPPPPTPEPEEMAAPEPFGADDGFGEAEPAMQPGMMDEESAPVEEPPPPPSKPVPSASGRGAAKAPASVPASADEDEELPPWEDSELPQDEPEPAPVKGKKKSATGPVPGKGKLPAKEVAPKAKPAPAAVAVEDELPADEGKKKKGKTASRVLLLFSLLLLVVVALLVLPVALPTQEPFNKLREVEGLKPVYEYVEKIFNQIMPRKGPEEIPGDKGK